MQHRLAKYPIWRLNWYLIMTPIWNPHWVFNSLIWMHKLVNHVSSHNSQKGIWQWEALNVVPQYRKYTTDIIPIWWNGCTIRNNLDPNWCLFKTMNADVTETLLLTWLGYHLSTYLFSPIAAGFIHITANVTSHDVIAVLLSICFHEYTRWQSDQSAILNIQERVLLWNLIFLFSKLSFILLKKNSKFLWNVYNLLILVYRNALKKLTSNLIH